ncbi:MAG: ABC transporter ATP-binding protein, partial [Flavobacteriaceae bacterium]|nr:ABC transporter ATP-binding protein [Flavobacteriaceae bacterium]
VSSHDLMHVTEVCERIVVLEKGQIVKDIVTAPATLKELEAYFSGAAQRPNLETESPESVPSENAHLEGSSPAIATEGVAEEGEK